MKPSSHARRRRFATTFLLLGIVLVLLGGRVESGSAAILLGWMAIDFLLLGVAYLRNWSGIFGKTPLGRFSRAKACLMAPFLILTWVTWWLQNLLSRSDRFQEVSRGVFVGRICAERNLPAGVNTVIDMTAEFPSRWQENSGRRYLYAPTLDGCAPSLADYSRVSEFLKAGPAHGIYFCCANGYGRSVTMAAAMLGRLGVTGTMEEAITIIQRVRPLASPNGDQMVFLQRVYQRLASEEK